jgi:glycosyltransferase involved in cell wall biosynthesis
MRRPFLSVVVPGRDEAAVLPEFHKRLVTVLSGMDARAEVVYVDDGSTDGTWEFLTGLVKRDARVRAVRLSRSFGHQAALSAGIDRASGDAVVTIDADLQDPPELIPELVVKWREGFAVVHARRTRRLGEGWAKRGASFLFHRLLRLIADVPIIVDTADFRLLDRSACEVLRRMPERHRYLRGLAVWAGFPQAEVRYARQPRKAGRAKYRFGNMISLGLDAIVSFSRVPLKIATWLGVVVVPLSLALLVVGLVRTSSVRTGGWITPVALLALLDGIVLLLLGVLGAYVARVGDEARARPLYVVREEAGKGTPLRKGRGASGGSARSARRT